MTPATVRSDYCLGKCEYLDLSLITADNEIQPRVNLNQKVINEYAQQMAAGTQFPPLLVFLDGTYYWLIDGFLRLEAAKQIERNKILVEVRQGNRREALRHSVGVNSNHGLKRSNKDKRRAVEVLLRDSEWSQMSDREIARACGVSNTFVSNVLQEIQASVNGLQIQNVTHVSERPTAERIVQRNGKIYTINTANIGRSKSRNSSSVSDNNDKTNPVEELPFSSATSPQVEYQSSPDNPDIFTEPALMSHLILKTSYQSDEIQGTEIQGTEVPSPLPEQQNRHLGPAGFTYYHSKEQPENAVQLQLRCKDIDFFRNSNLDPQAPKWVGQIAEVLEVGESRLKAIVEISCQQ